MSDHTHPQYLEFVGEQIATWQKEVARQKLNKKLHEEALLREFPTDDEYSPEQQQATIQFNLDGVLYSLKKDKTILSAWLAIHDGLIMHAPDKGEWSEDAYCYIPNTVCCRTGDDLFPCPSYLDITKHLDTVMEQG